MEFDSCIVDITGITDIRIVELVYTSAFGVILELVYRVNLLTY